MCIRDSPTHDGGFVLSGVTRDDSTPLYDDLFLLKVDSLGNQLWTKEYGRSKDELSAGVLHADNNGFYLVASTQQLNDDFDVYIIKTDSLGISLANQCTGNIYYDTNENCTQETGEQGMPQWLIKATKGNIEHMQLTCLLYTSPSPRDATLSRMPSSA